MNLLTENFMQTWSENDTFSIDRYRQIAKYAMEGQVILDVGCNTGRGGKVLSEVNDIELYGVEIVHERINKIPQNLYIKIFNESIVYTKCDNLKFDLIIAGEVIEHIPPTEFNLMLINCKALLSDNGKIVFTTPNPNSYLVKLGRNKVFKDLSHVNILGIKKLKDSVESAGLQIIHVEGSGKASRILGYSFPLNFYGSYLVVITK